MRVDYECPACEGIIEAPTSLEGKSFPCPQCNATIKRWPAPKKAAEAKPESQPPVDDRPTPHPLANSPLWIERFSHMSVKDIGISTAIFVVIVIALVVWNASEGGTRDGGKKLVGYTEVSLQDKYLNMRMEEIELEFGTPDGIYVTPIGYIDMLKYGVGRINATRKDGKPGHVTFLGKNGRCQIIDVR